MRTTCRRRGPRGCGTTWSGAGTPCPNALLPTITLILLNLGFVVSGAITIETVFSWPGLGLLSYEALNAPDFPLLQGFFLLFSAAVIVANLIADLLLTVLRPQGAARMSAPTGSRRPRRRPAATAAAMAPGAATAGAGRSAAVLARVPPGPARMIGLVILVFMIVVALAAPLLATPAGSTRSRGHLPRQRRPEPARTRSAPTTTAARC